MQVHEVFICGPNGSDDKFQHTEPRVLGDPRLVEQASEPCVSAVAAAWQHLGPLTALGRSAGLHAGRRLGDGMCEHTHVQRVSPTGRGCEGCEGSEQPGSKIKDRLSPRCNTLKLHRGGVSKVSLGMRFEDLGRVRANV